MIVYHGSDTEIKQINLSKCEPHRDFGQGFYVTKFRHHAENWAKRKSRFKHNGSQRNDGIFATENTENTEFHGRCSK